MGNYIASSLEIVSISELDFFLYTCTDLNCEIISLRLRCEPATMISMLKLDVLSQMGSAWK